MMYSDEIHLLRNRLTKKKWLVNLTKNESWVVSIPVNYSAITTFNLGNKAGKWHHRFHRFVVWCYKPLFNLQIRNTSITIIAPPLTPAKPEK